MTKLQKSPSNGWDAAVRLLERWLDKNERADALLESLKTTLPTDERARCQYLLYGTLRHFSLLDGLINAHVTRPPRALLRALLLVASYELLQGRAKAVALVVDHAVERGKALVSVSEVRLINAVMRKLAIDVVAKVERAAGLAEATEDASQLAEIFSHPQWLVDRWLRQFGLESTRKLLAWNQEPGLVHARWRATGETPPEFLKPTKWAGFYEVPSGHWAEIGVLLEAGKLYLQDPATRLAPLALGVRKGETVLDCCAAPGGKSLFIADLLEAGRIVAVDEPGKRLERLKENLGRIKNVDVALVQSNLLNAEPMLFKELGLPTAYDAVLIDVPCSNTGVMRHRVDAKWRLREADIAQHAAQQLELLFAAARLVAPGGRIVYSTCSLEKEENEGVISKFLRARGKDFSQENRALSRPWETGHDGSGVFLLSKKK